MNYSRLVPVCILLLFCLGWVSCSTTSEVADSDGSEQNESTVFPEWYNEGQTFVSGDNGFRAFANALAGDSAGAADKAVTLAKKELESGISRRLESIRKKALDELGKETGLATPGFIMTMRKAEVSIPNTVETRNVQVERNDTYSGYRAFAEVVVNQDALKSELDQAMSHYRTSWGKMKESKAFSLF